VTTKALEVYDQQRFGPVLGVSDEGAAAQTIADAAYASAKAKAVDAADAMVVGMILDGERMGSAGEVPIGPDEYAQVLPAAQGRIFCTTNVGVRVNTRFYQPLPEFRVADTQSDEQKWLDGIFEKFKPFINTPDGNPRPLMVRLVTESRQCQDALRELVPKLEAGRKNGRLGSSDLHRLSILVVFDDEIRTSAEVEQIRQLMTLASELGVPEVAVDGRLVEAARRRISIQGLLNILDPDTARSLLRLGQELGVRVTYHFELDPETAARTVWTGLNSAHGCGLTAAKYGLFPLKLDQQRHVVRNVQRWMGDWTPIPAFYVDTALVTDDDVFESDRCVEAARLWMDMIVAEGAKVALVDAPDRIEPHRLLRRSDAPDDPGILSMDDVATLLGHAQNIGLKVLWSGGNSAQQAYELGKLGVFGIFTTGSTARVVPVHGTLEGDKQLAMEKEPTELGVRRVHALLQGGYVWSVLGDGDGQIRDEIEARSVTLLGAASDSDACRTALASFDEVLVRGWKKYWADVA
jgi:hypothetical protein